MVFQKKYYCNQCEFKTVHQCSLNLHKRRHTNVKPFHCDLCDFKALHKNSFILHKMKHTNIKPYKCDLCDFKTIHKNSLGFHKNRHIRIGAFVCGQCNYTTGFKTNLVHHKNIHLKEKQSGKEVLNDDGKSEILMGKDFTKTMMPTEDKPFSCDACDYKATSLILLTNHKIKHSNEKPFSCDQCEYKTKRKISLRFHKMTHRISKPFKCDQCDFKTIYKNSIMQHKKKHSKKNYSHCKLSDNTAFHKPSDISLEKNQTNEKPCESNLGDFKTRRKNSLRFQKRKNYNENQFHCDQCDFIANFKSDLVVHKASHLTIITNLNCGNVKQKKILNNNQSNDKMIEETNCSTICVNKNYNKAFTDDQFDYTKAKETSKALEHEMKHSNENQFLCDLCDLKFSNKKEFMLHENIHNSKDIFRCEVCDFRIFHKNSFILHLLKHDLFQCDMCCFITNFKDALESHKNMHMKETFCCNLCDYETKSEKNLVQHRLLHRDINPLHFETTNQNLVHLDPVKKPEEKSSQFHVKCTMENYQSHKEERNKETFYCDQCDFKTQLENNLIQHKLIHMGLKTSHDIINFKMENKGMSNPLKIAEEKSLQFDYKSTVDNLSQKIKTNEQSFYCNQCDFKTRLENNLIHHKLIHLDEKLLHDEINCEMKDKSMSNPLKITEKKSLQFDYKLDTQSQRIEDNETFCCDQCEFKTHFLKNLLQHKLIHMDLETSSDVVNCEIENKHTLNPLKTTEDYKPSTVDKRSQSIEENEPFCCDQCDFKTQLENNLIHHKLIHVDEKLSHDEINCEMEDKSTSNPSKITEKNSLQFDYKSDTHSQRIEDNATFYCDQCDFKTRFKKSLIQHKLTHMDLDTSHDDYMLEDKAMSIPLKITEEKSLQFDYKSAVVDNHSQEAEDNVTFYCDRCDFKTLLGNNLIQHKLIHMDEKSSHDINFEMENKGMSNPLKITKEKSLEVNYKSAMVNKQSQEIEDNETFYCDQCDFKTLFEKKSVQHKLYHMNLMPAHETVNNNGLNSLKQTKEKSQLHFKSRIEDNLSHEIEHNEIFYCDQCNFKTKSEKKSIQHKIFHMEQKSPNPIYSEGNLNLQDQMEAKTLPFHFKLTTEGDLSLEIESSKEKCHNDQFNMSQLQNNLLQDNMFFMDIQPTHYINFETMDKSLINFNPFKKPKENILNFGFKSSGEDNLSYKIESNRLSCDKCDFIGRDRTNLFNHKRKHTVVKPYACDQCNYKAKTKYGLSFHIMKHNDDKPFHCLLCDFKSVYKNSLLLHQRKHGDEKPFHCDLCDFKALHKNSLMLHKMKHTNIKPYECDECDFKTIHKNSLGLHKQRHVRIEQYNNCNLCDFKSLQKNTLISHKKNHNNEK